MGVEIERKFLVHRDLWEQIAVLDAVQATANLMDQGYLSRGEVTVRIRNASKGAFLTIKGPEADGSRLEFEYPIPSAEATEMLDQLAQSRLQKTRYTFEYGEGAGRHLWEVDVFAGVLKGLILAEVELQNRHDPVDLPPWVSTEVTGNFDYHNSTLASKQQIPALNL